MSFWSSSKFRTYVSKSENMPSGSVDGRCSLAVILILRISCSSRVSYLATHGVGEGKVDAEGGLKEMNIVSLWKLKKKESEANGRRVGKECLTDCSCTNKVSVDRVYCWPIGTSSAIKKLKCGSLAPQQRPTGMWM